MTRWPQYPCFRLYWHPALHGLELRTETLGGWYSRSFIDSAMTVLDWVDVIGPACLIRRPAPRQARVGDTMRLL